MKFNSRNNSNSFNQRGQGVSAVINRNHIIKRISSRSTHNSYNNKPLDINHSSSYTLIDGERSQQRLNKSVVNYLDSQYENRNNTSSTNINSIQEKNNKIIN